MGNTTAEPLVNIQNLTFRRGERVIYDDMSMQFCTCRSGGIGRAENGPDGGAGDLHRPHTEAIQRFQHHDMRQPARAARAENQPDARMLASGLRA